MTAEIPPEEKEDEGGSFEDAEFPEVKPFYEQKYEDGLEGVWRDKRAEFEDTEFMKFLQGFIPSFSGGVRHLAGYEYCVLGELWLSAIRVYLLCA
ncbi:hypothetical protein [Pseudomonas aeruginosa]|uniref:hypothetical protein n=1 Tax=Pseudomonas aeruginosa TaxID=287 RepID=UPI0012FE2391|nr:hypothetical protein [Pseudomonas aeruginosa]